MSNLLTSMFSCDSSALKKEPVIEEEDKKLPDQIIGALDRRTGIYVFKQQPRRSSSIDNMFADIIREVRS